MTRKHNGRGRTGMAQDAQTWWAPKRYGYGANLPIAWQGWAVSLAYCALLAGAVFLFLPDQMLPFIALILVATAIFVVIVARKTRWGEEG